jgi:hypothetical protein
MNTTMGHDLDTTRTNRRNILKVSGATAAALIHLGPGTSGAAARGEPGLEVVSPADGATVNMNDIQVELAVSNFALDGAAFGLPGKAGAGEIFAFVDGGTIAQLTNFYSTDRFVIAGDGLMPGQHTLTFLLASSTHVPIMSTAKRITIDFRPPNAIPLPIANDLGEPSLKLVSPQDGATVASTFEVQVQPTNFTAATALEGKTNVPGYGHYHVWVDAPEMPFSLAGLVLMPGTNGFTLNPSAWGEGEHTVRIEPAQNDHTMYDPATPVTFTVTVSATAGPSPSARLNASSTS